MAIIVTDHPRIFCYLVKTIKSCNGIINFGTVELYTYDTYNRLTSYEGGDTYAEYGYNAEDYRCYKNVQENGFFDETYYFYEGSHVIMEADSTGTITAHNMYGTHLAARTVDGQSCYYLYNAHGDVVMLMDAVTGEIAGTYQYDAFGTLLWSDGYADNSITYAGYQYDEESGLYYLNARYYDSTTARFLTEDTYRGRQNDPLSLNRYTYCHNNPLIYWDPTGHEAQKYEEDYFVSLTTGNRHPRCKLGSRGSYVCQMERILEAAGYRPGDSSDGIFDENTLRAVKLFQRDNGLNVTGIVEQKAWAYLQIQQDLKRLESRYKCQEISKEDYESYVNGLKRKANNVPYMYDDITPEDVEREMYSRFYVGLTIETSLLEAQAMVLTMGASEIMGDGVDLIYDVSNALVNPSPNAVGSIVFDSVCLLIPDGPLNYADNVADDAVDVWRRTGKSGTSAKGLIGHDFEDYLSKTIGGEGSFSVGGRDFDGGIGNRWREAKSGNYWSMLEENPNKLAKFKSDMGDRLRIATENGATYEIFSNTPIPESIKQWLTKKGITFTELLD